MKHNVNLSDAELATVDQMISYLQQSNKTTIDKTFDSIFSAINCFNSTAPTQSVAVQAAQQAVQQAAHAAAVPAITTFSSSTCISGLVGVGTGMLQKGASLEGFFEKLADGKNDVSLNQLIAIRNQSSGLKNS